MLPKSDQKWTISSTPKTKGQNQLTNIEWCPIFEHPNTKNKIGITRETGFWVIELNEKEICFPHEQSYIPFLSLLEFQRQEIQSLLEKGFKTVEPIETKEFPDTALVLAALLGPSLYWRERALDWAEDLPYQPDLAQALSNLATSKENTQATRHKARAILKKNM